MWSNSPQNCQCYIVEIKKAMSPVSVQIEALAHLCGASKRIGFLKYGEIGCNNIALYDSCQRKSCLLMLLL